MGDSFCPAPDRSRELRDSHWRRPLPSVTPMIRSSWDSPVARVTAWGKESADMGWPLASMAMDDPVKIWWLEPELEAVAEDAGGGLVVGRDLAVLVEEHDPLAERGHHGLVALLGGPAAGLGLAGIGELGAHHHPARRLGVVVDEGVDRHQDVDLGAVLAAVGALAALEHGGAVGAVGGHHGGDGQARDLLLGPAVECAGGLVPALDPAVGVDTDDGVGDVGHQAGPVPVGGLGGAAARRCPGRSPGRPARPPQRGADRR